MSALELGSRVRLVVDWPFLGKGHAGTVTDVEPDLVRVVFDVWDASSSSYRLGVERVDGAALIDPAELEVAS